MIKKAQEIITKVEEIKVGPGNPPNWRLFRVDCESGNNYGTFNGEYWHSQIGNFLWLEFREETVNDKHGNPQVRKTLIDPEEYQPKTPQKPQVIPKESDKFAQIMDKLNEISAENWEIKEILKKLQ